jgi:Trk K+ transport system NAD-binding subunit
MLFDVWSLIESPWLALATMAIVIIGKPLAALVITVALGYPLKTAPSVGAVLSQIGEFSFIVATLGMKYGLVREEAFNALVATAIVSITLAPLLYRGVAPLEGWVAKRPALWKMLNRTAAAGGDGTEESDDHRRRAVVVGYGPVGKTVTRLLKENGFSPVIVEMNVDTVKRLREEGERAQYGDASHPETLKSAGTGKADILVLSASGVGGGREVIQEARRLNPAIRVVVRANYRREADELLEAGADAVYSDEGEVALSMTEGISSGASGRRPSRSSARATGSAATCFPVEKTPGLSGRTARGNKKTAGACAPTVWEIGWSWSRSSQREQLLFEHVLGDIGADDLVLHFAVFEKQQERDAADAVFHRQVAGLVDIHLAHLGLAFDVGGELVDDRADHLAGSAPLGPEVHEHGDGGIDDFGLEIAFVELLSHARKVEGGPEKSRTAPPRGRCGPEKARSLRSGDRCCRCLS